ncbi:MAG: hypothetical protein NT013_30440, partial [Planctomycetia bacterium]|nr:hypothetical protein [Planctomycetia bacterium]
TVNNSAIEKLAGDKSWVSSMTPDLLLQLRNSWAGHFLTPTPSANTYHPCWICLSRWTGTGGRHAACSDGRGMGTIATVAAIGGTPAWPTVGVSSVGGQRHFVVARDGGAVA